MLTNGTELAREEGRNPAAGGGVLESVSDCALSVDGNWRVTALNRAAEEATGVSREAAVGRACCDVLKQSMCRGHCSLMRLLSGDGEMVARSHAMREIAERLPRIAESGTTVLIEGGSGTGKELVARRLHAASGRAGRAFVTVNCAALPDALLENEIFGYEAGAFRDAARGRRGRLEEASGGTLFLDEIGDISPALQVRLLRVLQESEYRPAGSEKTLEADARLIAATGRNLDELVTRGRFRQDLFYRVNVVRITIPPLRERTADIQPLVEHFIARLNAETGRGVSGLDPAATAAFMRYEWPGNVRELVAALEHAYVLCPGQVLKLEHMPAALLAGQGSGGAPPGATLRELEAWAIRQALAGNGGRRRDAARQLGIDPSTLWRKMKRMGLR